jgi:lipopolysaccharide transport system ATP-binding protein
MNENAISVYDVSKQYRLGIVGRKSLSQDVNRWWHTVRGKEDPYLKIGEENDRSKKGSSEYVWALSDINFDVKKGEIVGIIGRNGAGKSTLLKILSKVTMPTTGNIGINGRLASLLEVGTGFNPELSGRDNIFLNGAILGMTKKEINSKLDEIIAFSGVERYIDTPVKRYSSGMYVRLAFSVAAHLDPDILIVDEVLAVGDFEFQKQCIKKMTEVSTQQNRTILFVSHDLKAVSSFCKTGIYMKNGRIAFQGEIGETLNKYTSDKNLTTGGTVNSDKGIIAFQGITNADKLSNLNIGTDIEILLALQAKEKLDNVFIDLAIYNEAGDMLIHLKTKYISQALSFDTGNLSTVSINIEKPNLSPGGYLMTLYIYQEHLHKEVLLWVDDIPLCRVNSNNPYFGNGSSYLEEVRSFIYPKATIKKL